MTNIASWRYIYSREMMCKVCCIFDVIIYVFISQVKDWNARLHDRLIYTLSLKWWIQLLAISFCSWAPVFHQPPPQKWLIWANGYILLISVRSTQSHCNSSSNWWLARAYLQDRNSWVYLSPGYTVNQQDILN